MVIWIKFTDSHPFSSLVPKMLMFTLAISCMTTSDLPWFMDLTFHIPLQYCSLQHQTWLPSPITSAMGVVFSLALSLHSFWIISPLISSSILGTYQPRQFIFQCPIFLPFHAVHGVLKARILKWFAFPSPVDHIFSELSTMTCPSWVALRSMAHSFIELDKAVVHVIRLVSFLSLWFTVCLPSDREWQEAHGNFLVGETDRGRNWALFWLAGPCPVNC